MRKISVEQEETPPIVKPFPITLEFAMWIQSNFDELIRDLNDEKEKEQEILG